MRTIYPPEQTRRWTQADLDGLVGKFVTVEVPASELARAAGGHARHEGVMGMCVGTELFAYGQPAATYAKVRLDHGMGWVWLHADGAWVAVCDEHGDHALARDGVQDPEVLACLETLGAPPVAGVTE
jgi:hypothetical protein